MARLANKGERYPSWAEYICWGVAISMLLFGAMALGQYSPR